MAKQMTIEQIMDQLGGAEEKTRDDLLAEILEELQDQMDKFADEEAKPGLRWAIELIDSNWNGMKFTKK
jgi:hypothetical protein